MESESGERNSLRIMKRGCDLGGIQYIYIYIYEREGGLSVARIQACSVLLPTMVVACCLATK